MARRTNHSTACNRLGRARRFVRHMTIASLMALMTFGIGGCKKSSGLVEVKGKVSVDGKPAAGAIVMLHPENSADKIAAGVADKDGVYSLVTDLQPGAKPGHYKVSVTWPDPNAKQPDPQKSFQLPEPGPDLLKGRYMNKDRSQLTADIAAESKELPPLELKTK